ncbi:MAG: hypothetical protein IJU44_01985 [Kiritimatiellae bacterium]|nr:hypothetical protein [Kiritimatiellia bacterium]
MMIKTIDGLPVRKIMDSAFVACSQLTSITIPATVREVVPMPAASGGLVFGIVRQP